MKRIVFFAWLLAGCATVDEPPAPAPTPVKEAEIRSTMAVLASDEFEGRMAGTLGADKTVAYIAERFRAAGLESGASGSAPYLQAFTVDRKAPPVTGKPPRMPPAHAHFVTQMDRRGPFTTWNVVGNVAGRNSDGRAVIVMAHWDHLGLCLPEGAADRICNGAVDNASGIAAMIAVAEQVARMKLDRDVWFVATGAEEWGLLGALAFADKPPLPLASIIAGFNLDTIAIAPRGMPVAMIAAKGSPLVPLVLDAAKAMGRPWDGDDQAASFMQRQDGWAFAQRGVPVVMAGGSFSDMRYWQKFLAGRYHTPDDELRPDSELGGAVEDANLHVELVRRAASRGLFPSFSRVPALERR